MDDCLKLDDDELFTLSDFEDDNDFCANSQKSSAELNYFPEFNCNEADDFSENCFNRNGFVNNLDVDYFTVDAEVKNDFKLFGHMISRSSIQVVDEICIDLVRKARMNVQKILILTDSKKKLKNLNESVQDLRMEVRTFLHTFRRNLELFNLDFILSSLKSLRNLFGTFDSISEYVVMHSSSVDDNASYHFLHLQLEWRWIYLTILLKMEMIESPEKEPACGLDFQRELQLYMFDLMSLSLCKFNGQSLNALSQSSPFICNCLKESWLLIQLLIEKLSIFKKISFWDVFNKTLTSFQKFNHDYKDFKSMEILLRNSKPFPNKNPTHFSCWLLMEVAKLQGYNKNGEEIGKTNTRVKPAFKIVENLIKTYLKTDPPEDELRSFLILVAPLLIDYWPPNVISTAELWEFFNKKINSSFFIKGASLCSLAVVYSSGINYLQNIKTQMDEKLNLEQTSFTMFVYILGAQLKRFVELGQTSQILKIFGRIYSKFPSERVLGLTEVGIHNVIRLFVTFGLTANMKELNYKIQDILLQSPLDKMPLGNQTNVMKGHVAILILYTEQEIDLSSYIAKLIIQLKSIADNYNEAFPVMKILIDGVIEIFKNKQSFELGAHKLLDSWIAKYLQLCTSAERDRFIKSLSSSLIEIQEFAKTSSFVEHIYSKIVELFFRYTLPTVKKIYLQEADAIFWIPQIAANLCLCATGIDGIPKFEDLFKFFADNNCPNMETTIQFLKIILSTNKIETMDPQVIMMAWLKCLIVSTETSNDLRELTRIVVGLDGFQNLCSSEGSQIVAAKDPLYVYFAGVAVKYQSCQDTNQKFEIADKIDKYLLQFVKWNSNYEQSQVSLRRLFHVIAIILKHCSEVVYIRSKSSCFFNVSISTYILPNNLMIGKTVPPNIVQMVHEIWHIIMEGIGKLKFKTDPQILMTATDLILKWTPLFKISSNSKIVARPFINCLNNSNSDEMSEFILQKLSSTFISLEGRQPHSHSCLVVTIFNEIFLRFKENESKMKILLENVNQPIMEHAMMSDEIVPSRKLILNLLKNLLQSSTFRGSPELQGIVTVNLKTLTSMYLSSNSQYYFQFLTALVKINSQVVGEVMQHLWSEIEEVEETHGNGRNVRLRQLLENVQKSLQ